MPISGNTIFCAAHGFNTTPCWYNYVLQSANSTLNNTANPNPIGIISANLPWWGAGLWIVTYIAIFILFQKSGGREKFMAMGIGGFLATIAYAQAGILGTGSAEIGIFALTFFILIISAIAYALIKDTGE